MAALVCPDEEECYLLAILDGADGLDLAEFAWYDPESLDGCYRAWDYQWSWYVCEDMFQVDQGGRSTGKTVSITMRAFAFPFNFPGQRMLVTAPELNHLRPLTDAIESRLLSTRLGKEMLPSGQGNGMNRQPHWQARFKNGAQIISRLPNKDGKGVKGMHVIQVEMDECFPAGTLVLTRTGHKPIEDVRVGDEVLTHRNRWRPVTATMTRERETCTVIGQGHPGITCSTNHKFYVRQAELRPHRLPGGGWARKKALGDPQMVSAANLAPADECPSDNKTRDGAYHWATPTVFPPEALPLLPPGFVVNEDFWWLLGFYLAEGNCSAAARCWIVPTKEVQVVCDVLDSIGAGWRVSDVAHGDAKRLYLIGTGLRDWLIRHCGRRGKNDMRVPTWVLGQSEDVRRSVLAGYVWGGGNYTTDARYAPGRWEATCVNRELVLTVKLLAQSLGYSVAIQRGVQYQLKAATRSYADELDGQRFSQVKQVLPVGRIETLYDLTVDEDASFVAETVTVSNSQDYPLAGWIEIVECLNRFMPNAMMRCHGVPKGTRDRFFDMTEGSNDEDRKWTIHRPMAMHRPTWADTERQEKIKEYGGSRQSIDYKRNIYGEHGDAANSVFVLSRLAACVDMDDGSVYNSDVYAFIRAEYERMPQGAHVTDLDRQAVLLAMIDPPGTHRVGYSQKTDGREVGSPKGYSAYWGGADIGVTSHPSEFLIAGQRDGTDLLELLLRIQLQRIPTEDQMLVVEALFNYYGDKLKAFAMDSTGVGQPIWDMLHRHPHFGSRIYGYNFSEHVVVGFEDRPLEGKETQADLAIRRNVVEATTDWLRNDYVDAKKIRLPYDREVLLEMQGQVYTVIRDTGNPYGTRRVFSGGSFHTLDALKVMVGGKHLPPLQAMLEQQATRPPVLDLFVGM